MSSMLANVFHRKKSPAELVKSLTKHIELIQQPATQQDEKLLKKVTHTHTTHNKHTRRDVQAAGDQTQLAQAVAPLDSKLRNPSFLLRIYFTRLHTLSLQ
jgi:hypothetical protein